MCILILIKYFTILFFWAIMLRREYLLNKFNDAISREDFFEANLICKDMIDKGFISNNNREYFESSLQKEFSVYRIDYSEEFFQVYAQFSKNYSAFLESNRVGSRIVFESEDDFKDWVNLRIEFHQNKVSVKTENFNSPMLSKNDIIKCASDTSPEKVDQVSKLIDQVWHNKYYDALFSMLAIYIVEGGKLNFIFSNKLGLQFFGNYLETNFRFEAFVHESYHALQNVLFDGKDYYDGLMSDSKESFLNSFEQFSINVVKLLSIDDKVLASDTWVELVKLIHQEILDSKVQICNIDVLDKTIGSNIENYKEWIEISINNGEEFSGVEQLIEKTNEHCAKIESKYQVPAHVIERIAYPYINYNFSYDSFSNYEDFSELIPVVFELMAMGTEDKYLEVFSPIFSYVEQEVIPIIEKQKALHIEHYCLPLLDTQNQQCLNSIDYIFFSEGRCIVDFLDDTNYL